MMPQLYKEKLRSNSHPTTLPASSTTHVEESGLDHGVDVTPVSSGDNSTSTLGTPITTLPPTGPPAGRRKKWTKDDNITLMKLYYQSRPSQRGFRKRLHSLWQQQGQPVATEQKLAGQANSVINNHLLTEEELAELRGPVSQHNTGNFTASSRTPSQRRQRHFPEEQEESYEDEATHSSDTAPVDGTSQPSSTQAKPKKRKWTREDNITLMELYFQSNPQRQGYRKRLLNLWLDKDLPTLTEGRLADQARSIQKNGLLSTDDLKAIKDRVGTQRPRTPELQRPSATDINSSVHPPNSQAQPASAQAAAPPADDPIADDMTIGDWPDSQPPSFRPEAVVNEVDTGGNLEEPLESSPTGSTPTESAPTEEEEIPGLDEMMSYLRRLEIENSEVPLQDFGLTTQQLEYRAKIVALLNTPENIQTKILRHVNRKKLSQLTEELNAVVQTLDTPNITETNTLLRAAAHVVREALGEKVFDPQAFTKPKDPKWKRRIEGKIRQDRSDISQLTEMQKGKTLKKKITDALYRRHPLLNKKGFPCIIEELKQRLMAKAHKIKRYNKRVNNFKQNKLFKTNQRQFYRNLNTDPTSSAAPQPTDTEKKTHTDFWKSIWEDPAVHNSDAPWLEEVKAGLAPTTPQEPLKIEAPEVTARVKKMANWSSAGTDGLHVYWLKHLTTLHPRIASQLMHCVTTATIPLWMTEGRTHLLMKDPSKGTTPGNYRPITCLPAMWKLLTGVIADEVYWHLNQQSLLPSEQKGCKKFSRGCKEQLLLDKLILKNCKRRKTALHMAYIDYKKAYDKIPHSWILESMQMCGVAPNIISFFQASLSQSTVRLQLGQSFLGNIQIKRGIFQGDSVSPLQFVIGLIPLSFLLRKQPAGYVLSQGGPKINHKLYMDDLKLYGKTVAELESLLETTKTFSTDICMEFGLDKCASIKLEKGKKTESEGITLPDGTHLKDLGEQGYRYLGILEADQIFHSEMKAQTTKEYLRRLKKILKSGLSGKHCIDAINTWAIPVIRYGAGIVNWGLGELKQLDIKTRKLMKLHRAHHPQGDVDRLYVSRKRGGRGLQNAEEVVCREQNAMTTYFSKSQDPELVALVEHLNRENLLKGEVIDKKDDKDKDEENHRNKWKDKRMHGQYARDLERVADGESSWNWLHQQDLKKETEGLIIAAQDQALRTNMIKFHIDKTSPSPRCRLCHNRNETVDHILSGCEKLAQSEYKKRHDKVAAAIHWCMCKKHHIQCEEKWYQHRAEKVTETDDIKLLWDFPVQNDHVIEARRPDIILVEKKKRNVVIIDISVPGDTRIVSKEEEKILKYQDLKREIKQVWNMTTVKVVPIVVGALGAVSTNFQKYLDEVDCHLSISSIQKAALLGSARILRMVLDI